MRASGIPVFLSGEPYAHRAKYAAALARALRFSGVKVEIMRASEITTVVKHDLSAPHDIAVINVLAEEIPAMIEHGMLLPVSVLVPDASLRTLHPLSAIFASGGKQYAIPKNIACGLFFARRDILDRYGFDIPRTWDELVRFGREIRKNRKGPVLALRGKNGWAQTFLEYYWSNGGSLLSEDGAMAFDAPRAQGVLSFLSDLVHIHKLMPRAFVTRESWKTPEDITDGRLVFAQASSDALPKLAERYRASFEERFKIGLCPIGPAGTNAATYIEGSCFAVPRTTAHPRAARDVLRFFCDRNRSGNFDTHWLHPFPRYAMPFAELASFPWYVRRGCQLLADARIPQHDMPLAPGIAGIIESAVISCLDRSATPADAASAIARALTRSIGRRYSSPVARAVTHIRTNFSKQISLADIARISGLTRAHLTRLFTRETGMSPGRYRTDVRIRHAERLLEGGATAAHTAAASGFSDAKYFFRAFKRATGKTPASYRRSRRA
ncbi:MAG: extracellular solute-binding protein [Spirochaetota bacterium]